MNAGQYEGLMARLGEIMDRMPERPAPEPAQSFTVNHLDGSKTITTTRLDDGSKTVVHVPAEPVRTGWPYEREGPAPVPTDVAKVDRQPGEDPETTGARQALVRMLSVLDGWIEGARENHDALGHRGENRGEECWRSFAPSDIRNMVNDVARELGLAEFPVPANVVFLPIDRHSGAPVDGGADGAIREAFISGTQPGAGFGSP
jgi:hypothetical protein